MNRTLRALLKAGLAIVALIPWMASAQYCVPSNSTCDEALNNVVVGSINNPSGCTNGGPADYTAQSTTMSIGVGYTITVTTNLYYGTADVVHVWVDWNHNLSFTDNANEHFIPTDLGGTYSGTITPPAGALSGAARMRIRMEYFGTGDPCNAQTYGEVEDYTVNVGAPPACAQPTGLTATGVTATGATINWTCAACTGSYYVEYAPTATAALPGTGATAGGSNSIIGPIPNGSVNQVLGSLLAGTQYKAYVRQNCGGVNGFSSNTGPVNFLTSPGCGGGFYDSGGPGTVYNVSGAANAYPNSIGAGSFTTLCPSTPGQVVTVTFTSFNAEVGWDPLYVFNGSTTADPKIAGTGGVPSGATTALNPPYGTGGWWDNTAPGTTPNANWPTNTGSPGIVRSTAANGCLTFAHFSDASINFQGWSANITCALPPSCPDVLGMSVSGILSTSANVNFNVVGGTYIAERGLPGFTPGTGASAGVGGTIVTGTTSPIALTGLSAGTVYTVYLRRECTPGVDYSPNANRTFTTEPGCGSPFYDNGGAGGNYVYTTVDDIHTICPGTPGLLATVSFSSFDTQSGWDPLYVFDGNSTAAAKIPSAEPPPTSANIYGTGGWSGMNAPTGPGQPVGTVQASSPNGCLTFAFHQSYGLGLSGWAANVTCVPAPTCFAVQAVSVTGVTGVSANVNFTGTSGNYIAEWGLPGFTPGTGLTNGVGGTIVTGATSPITITGLANGTQYSVYVRQVCSPTDISANNGPFAFLTSPGCGGSFFDPGGPGATWNSSGAAGSYANGLANGSITTICPNTVGDLVTVTFTGFNTEVGWDPLYVFDGNSTAAPKIAGTAGLASGATTALNPPYGTGGWWDNTAPGTTANANWPNNTGTNGVVTSSAVNGCLTFALFSDGSINYQGWQANITCAPANPCTRPQGVIATSVAAHTAQIAWTCNYCVGTYALEYGPPGFVPGINGVAGAGTLIYPATNPQTLTGLTSGTTYNMYVRLECSPGVWTLNSVVKSFTTAPDCGDNFYDAGGPAANYPVNSNSVVTLCPPSPNTVMSAQFTVFNTELGWDPLYVFDGNSTAAPKIAGTGGLPNTLAAQAPPYGTGGWWNNGLAYAPTNTGTPGLVVATNLGGCLTFAFISDGSGQFAGWAATLACLAIQPDCASAQPINCGEVKSSINIGPSNLPPTACSYNGAASTSGVSWWTHTSLVDEDVTFSTCNSATFNTRISIFGPSLDCSTLPCAAAVDDVNGCTNNTGEVTIHANAGETHYIAVHASGSALGTFQLAAFCAGQCNPPLGNDQCGTALSITSQLQDGSQTVLSDDNNCAHVDGPTACSSTFRAQGLWYSFNSGPNTVHRVRLLGNTELGTYSAPVTSYALYSGPCAGINGTLESTCLTTGGGYSTPPALIPNTLYHLFVYSKGGVGQSGTYGVTVDHPGYNDAGITSVISPAGLVCDQKFFPLVTLQNFGETTLTTVKILVKIDGSTVLNYTWNGSLVTGASEVVTLPLITSPFGAHLLTVTTVQPNNATDDITSNDASNSNYDATGQTVKVSITTDTKPAETTWSIYDVNFTPVAAGGPYGAPNTTTRTTVCLATTFGNCFSFYVFDSFGDGMCCGFGTGAWSLLNTLNEVILQDNGQFTSQSPAAPPLTATYNIGHEFCLPLGPSYPQNDECVVFDNLLQNKVYCHAVLSVTQYQFEFSDPDQGFRRRASVPRNWIKFSEMVSNPLVYGTHYFCRVKADQGATGFGDDFFGKGCEMGLYVTQPICTQLIDNVGSPTHSCGVTKHFGGSDKIWAVPIVGATQYRFRFSGGLIDPDGPTGPQPPAAGVRTITRPSYVNLMSWTTFTLVNGQTYSVTVEAFVGGNWTGVCGPACNVSILVPGNAPRSEVAVEVATDGVQLWPNPVRDGQVNLVINGIADADQHISVDVYDVFGKRVISNQYENSESIFRTTLDMSNGIASGAYMVNITVNDRTYTQRLVVQ